MLILLIRLNLRESLMIRFLFFSPLPCLTPRKIPWKFRVDIFIISVSRRGGSFMGVLVGHWGFLTGYLEDMVILDVMNDLILPQGWYTESFVLISLLEVCQDWGAKKKWPWWTLRVPDWILGGYGHSWCLVLSYITPRKTFWKFCVDICIGSVSRVTGQEWGHLEDIEGSWLETWRTWSVLMSLVILFYPLEVTLKILCRYLY